MNASGNGIWITQSKPGRQGLASILGVAVGVAIILGVRQEGLAPTTSLSALGLAGLVVVISLMVLITDGRQTITVDADRRIVRINQESRLGRRQRVIAFDDIADVRLGEIGDREGGSIAYFVQLRLKNGKDVGLFVGAYDGVLDRAAMNARRQRLADYLRA